MIVTLGVCVPRDAQAQTTVTPVQTTTFTLTPSQNPIIFGAGTNIDTTAAAGVDAVFGDTSTIWAVTNQGTIQGSLRGVFLGGAGSSLINSGTIAQTGNLVTSAGVRLANGGTVTNLVNATISDLVEIDGAPGTVTNAGTITAPTSTGVFLAKGGTVTNQVGGTIDGKFFGVLFTGLSATVVNAGSITTTGTTGNGVSSNTSTAISVTNQTGGTISGTANGISSNGTVTAINDGTITGDGSGIIARTVNVNSNAGKIEAKGTTSVLTPVAAIRAILDADIHNTNGLIQAITPGGGGAGILAGGIATVDNIGNGTTTGIITGDAFGISAATVHVTSNTSVIEATGVNGIAIKGTDITIDSNSGSIRATNTASGSAISGKNVTVTGNAGRIEATGVNGAGIQASTTLTVNNLSGGTISGGGFGIFANSASTVVVTNAAGGTISGGGVGIEILGSGTVTNAGTISGATNSVDFNSAGSTNTLILQTGSVLIGDAVGNATSTNKLILQGSGTANNNFAGFTSLDMASGNFWVLNGNSGVGAATISGILEVGDGAHASAKLIGNVTVNSGGQLAGQGTISGDVNVMSGGLVAPGAVAGTAIGTLTVTGNAAFTANSTFAVSANAAGQASKLAVGGTAALTDGKVQVLAQSGTFAPSTQYTILTAAGGLGGTTFGSVTSNLAFLTPSLSYTANNVMLTLVTNGSGGGDTGGGDTGGGGTGGGTGGGGTASTGFGFASVTQTRNQNAVATALDGGPVSNPLIIAVLNQTVAGARQAFDALSGEVFGSVHNAQGQEAQFARSAMLGRMRQASYAGAPGELGALGFAGPQLAYASADANGFPVKAAPGAQGPSRGLTFWAQGLGGWGHADSDGNAASLKSRFGGFLSGVDARFGETWRAGFVAGYMRSDLNVDARASSAGIDSVQFGGYASGRVGAFNVRGGASYSLDSIDTSRTIVFPGFADKASARFHGNVGQVFGEVGYGMAFGSVAVEPLAGLAYVHVRDGSFLESGGVAALSGASANENTGYSFLGVRAATAMPLANGTVLIPRGMLQWQHAFGDVTPATGLAFQGTGAAFSVAGIPIARDTALVEGGFDWRFSPQAKLGAFYQGELAAHAQTHAVKGGFTWDF
jgi:outer membrane autotransporter protein